MWGNATPGRTNLLIPQLLELCDKYNCLGAIHPWLDPKMDSAIKENTRYLELGDENDKWSFAGLTYLAFLVEDSELFRVATASMLYHNSPMEIAGALTCFVTDNRGDAFRTKLIGEARSSSFHYFANSIY